MNERQFPLLFTKFNSLYQEKSHAFYQKVAIWHVPDPKRLNPSRDVESGNTVYEQNQRLHESDSQSISFGGLKLAVHLVASQLRHHIQEMFVIHDHAETGDHVQAKSIIAILMPPGISRIITQIACMALNVAYLPLDRQVSTGRLIELINHVSPMIIVISRDYHERIFHDSLKKPVPGRLENLRKIIAQSSIVMFEDLFESLHYHHDCDDDVERITQPGVPCLFSAAKDPVVIILSTSGSTSGGPKLVRLRNSQLMNRLQWQWSSQMTIHENGGWNQDHCSKTPNNEIALASTAVLFVDAFTELFGSLFAGATVVVPGNASCSSEVCVSDLRVMSSLVQTFRITRLTTVPNQLKLWMNQLELIKTKGIIPKLDSLRTVVVSGDILLPELACHFFRKFTDYKIRLVNLYGTTEVAGDVTAAVFDCIGDVKKSIRHAVANNPHNPVMEVVPFLSVGTPIFHTTIFVLQKICTNLEVKESLLKATPDKEKRLSMLGTCADIIDWSSIGYKLCPVGCVGEIAVAGIPVKASITRLSEKGGGGGGALETTDDLKKQIYFPGDLGFVCPEDNQLYICGRSDELVKINAVGFLANEVDRLLSRIKEECINNPEQLSDTELKFSRVRESVTLPCQHPIQHECHLVCFYVLDPIQLDESSEQTLSSLSRTEEKVKAENKKLKIIVKLSETYDDCDQYPKPCELSRALAYYLPVYIRPVFIRVNSLPIISTSGKIDKELLRSAYQEFIISGRRNGKTELRVEYSSVESNISSEPISITRTSWTENPRDQAREILAQILGLSSNLGKSSEQKRPRDDEDFYFLGGNSLTAVLALESLRQLGFKIGLEIFFHDGNIGHILDCLASAGIGSPHKDFLASPNVISYEAPSPHQTVSAENIVVREWNDQVLTAATEQPSREELIQLLVEEFGKRDPISHAFELKWTDLELAASTYFKPDGHGIVLTATYQQFDNDGKVKEKLVGVLLSIPTRHLPDLPETEALSRLQDYFNYVASVNEPTSFESSSEQSLTVCMVGIRAPTPEQDVETLHTNRAKWNRVTLEILASLERQLLQVAKHNHYTLVETINTNETTKEICSELGYKTINSSRMQDFASARKLTLDRQFHDLHSHYMVKKLNNK